MAVLRPSHIDTLGGSISAPTTGRLSAKHHARLLWRSVLAFNFLRSFFLDNFWTVTCLPFPARMAV
jgi:hypothetical protein